MKPLAIDLFCGLGGWTEGLLAEGYDVVGFDIERHQYGPYRYPAQLVLQDLLTLHGSQFRDAELIVASPPCQFFSYTAMPWTRAKALAAEVRADPVRLEKELALFNTCFRIQREACEAAGRHVPLVVENVRGAIPWVGRSRWNVGSFHLWGDVPALMPTTRQVKIGGSAKVEGIGWTGFADTGASWRNRKCKVPGFRFDGSGRSFHSASVKQHGSGEKWWDKALDERRKEATAIKNGGGGADGWFGDNRDNPMRYGSSGSTSRKAASALIAKIPFELASHVAATYRRA